MKTIMVIAGLAMLITACDKMDPKVAQEKLRNTPGFKEARRICAQCHALPLPDQHPPAAWPSVVARMDGYIRASGNRRMATPEERQALIAYFQAGYPK